MEKRLEIIGAGIPSLALGVDILQRLEANGKNNVDLEIIEQAPPPAPDTIGDHRTTAFLPPSQTYLKGLGIWSTVCEQAAPLEALRLVDDRNHHYSAPLIETFHSREFGNVPFAMNISNSRVRQALIERFEEVGGTIKWNSHFDPSKVREHSLIIASDGQKSAVRQHLNIGLHKRPKDQVALVCTAIHSTDQLGVSTEFHRDTGPLTLIPFVPDSNNRHQSSIVWVETASKAKQLSALSHDDFCNRLQSNARGLLGKVYETSKPRSFFVTTQQSLSLGKPGVLLMAEAAHVLPPIGAQGLNVSLADAKALGQLLEENDDWLGQHFLDQYEQMRSNEISMRLNATDALNNVTTWQSIFRDPVTYLAFGLIKHVPAIRKTVVQTGLNPMGDQDLF